MPWPVNNKVTVRALGTVFGKPFNWYQDYRAGDEVTFSDLVGLGTAFRDDILTPGCAFQHTATLTAQLTVTNRSLPMPTVVLNVNLPGTYVAVNNLLPPPSLRFGMYKQVGVSYKWDDDEEETEYPIQRGYTFFPGLSEEWLGSGGINVPAAQVTAFADWRTDWAGVIVGGTVTFSPVVTGDDLPVSPPTDPPTYKRGEVYAFVQEIIFRRMTHMNASMGMQG